MLFPFTVIFFQLCKVKQFFPHSQIFLAKTLNFDDKYAKRGCAFYVSTQEKLEVFLLFF